MNQKECQKHIEPVSNRLRKLTEAKKLFGDDGLANYFEKANSPPWSRGILEKIDSWRGNAPINDDLTIVEIWRDPAR